MKIVIIGDKTIVLGCALAGIREGYVAGDINNAREFFSRCVERTDIGVILIGAEVAAMIPKEIQHAKRSSRLIPVITVVPGERDGMSPMSLQNQRDENVQEN
ncbi:MAG: V-type ATP synthase subunit F [Methanobacteriota archaeon]